MREPDENELRSAFEQLAPPVDVDAARLATSRRVARHRRHRRIGMGLASCALIAGVAAAVVANSRSHALTDVVVGSQNAPRSSTTTTRPPEATTSTMATIGVTSTTMLDGLRAPADPSTTIRFDGVGSLALGDVASGFETISGTNERGECGWASNDEFDGMLLGVMAGDPSEPSRARIAEIKVGDARYRTASGVGTGTTIDELRRVYGDRLVIDDPDGWDRPTDGLLASYRTVAGVRHDTFALTFVLEEDRVVQIEVSDAESWGDDEGCA